MYVWLSWLVEMAQVELSSVFHYFIFHFSLFGTGLEVVDDDCAGSIWSCYSWLATHSLVHTHFSSLYNEHCCCSSALCSPSPPWSCPPPSPRSWWWGRWCSPTPRTAWWRRRWHVILECRTPETRTIMKTRYGWRKQVFNQQLVGYLQLMVDHWLWICRGSHLCYACNEVVNNNVMGPGERVGHNNQRRLTWGYNKDYFD